VGFAKTGWKQWEKVMVTKAHEGAYRCRESPGHNYDPSGAGLSKKTTKIGTSLRPDLARSLGVDPHGSPGPKYNLRDSPPIGSYANSKVTPDKAFGLAGRFAVMKTGSNLGPGEYKSKPTLKLDTGVSFGAERKAYDKVISPGWEDIGKCAAGPGIGPPLPPMKDKNGFVMGSADRFSKSKPSQVPGPGYYRQCERDVSANCSAKGSPCGDTMRPATMKFGSPPKKPRFRMELAMRTGKHGGWGYF
jgi:hypothetical protein